MNTDSLIAEALAAAHAEGVGMDVIGPIEAKLFNALNRIRRINRAVSMLPLYGPDATAERIGCDRSTVYRLVKKNHELIQKQKVA
jgi:hypothetical protein